MKNTPSTSFKLIRATFEQPGSSLGFQLRRTQKGIVYVVSDAPGGVKSGDELHAVGDSRTVHEIGHTPLDNEAWKALLDYMKWTRPLRTTWRRKCDESEHGDDDGDEDAGADGSRGGRESTGQIPDDRASSFARCDPELVDLCTKRLRLKDIVADTSPTTLAAAGLGKVTNAFAIAAGMRVPSTSSTSPSGEPALGLIREGRHLVKVGEVMSGPKSGITNSIFSGMSKRTFFLMTDILVITALSSGNFLLVETVLELKSCVVDVSADGSETSWPFSIISSSAMPIVVIANSAKEKDSWVRTIVAAICDCVKVSGVGTNAVGWRHRYLIGALHGAVVSRDEAAVERILDIDDSTVNDVDEDGFSSLHLACMLPGSSSIVEMLLNAGADPSVRDRDGFTPLHWAATKLEDESVALLCAEAENVVDAVDGRGRTPLLLAVTEGRDEKGKSDAQKLSLVIASLVGKDANVEVIDSASGWRPIHFLACCWLHQPLECLLDSGANVLSFCEDGMNALHLAVVRKPPGEAVRGKFDGSSKHVDGVATLSVLLKAGARPNMKDRNGMSGLHLLVENAAVWGDAFGSAIDEMVSFGARLTENPPSVGAYIKSNEMVSLDDALEAWGTVQLIDADKLAIEKTPLLDFATDENIRPGQSGKRGKPKKTDEKDPDKECALCGTVFSLLRRKRQCALCDALCCDECSRKRAEVGEGEVRCCDACFNFLSSQEQKRREREKRKKMSKEAVKPAADTRSATVSRRMVRVNSSGSSAQSPGQVRGGGTALASASAPSALLSFASGLKMPTLPNFDPKKDLFGTFFDRGESAEREVNGSRGYVSGRATQATNEMSEVRDRLLERGERISRVKDKSLELSTNSSEYKSLTKQLRETQQNRWF